MYSSNQYTLLAQHSQGSLAWSWTILITLLREKVTWPKLSVLANGLIPSGENQHMGYVHVAFILSVRSRGHNVASSLGEDDIYTLCLLHKSQRQCLHVK